MKKQKNEKTVLSIRKKKIFFSTEQLREGQFHVKKMQKISTLTDNNYKHITATSRKLKWIRNSLNAIELAHRGYRFSEAFKPTSNDDRNVAAPGSEIESVDYV